MVCTLDASSHRIQSWAVRPLCCKSVIKFLCVLEIMKTVLSSRAAFSFSLPSTASLSLPHLLIPFGFTAGGTDIPLLTRTHTQTNTYTNQAMCDRCIKAVNTEILAEYQAEAIIRVHLFGLRLHVSSTL